MLICLLGSAVAQEGSGRTFTAKAQVHAHLSHMRFAVKKSEPEAVFSHSASVPSV
jgi:hypothetical protein